MTTATTATQTAPRRSGKKRAKRYKRTPDINEMRRQYEGGMGIRALADFHEISYGKAHDMLHESGVTVRPRGGSTRKPMSADRGREPIGG